MFAMARVKQELHALLDAVGFVEKVGEEHIYATLPTAVADYADYYTRVHGAPPPGSNRSATHVSRQ